MTSPTTTIRIVTPEGEIKDKEVPLVVAYTGSPLALTESCPGVFTITHRPTGKRVGPTGHRDQGELTQLLDRLVELHWDAPDAFPPTGGVNPQLSRDVQEITSDWVRTFKGTTP